MIKRKVYCDRCGEQILERGSIISPTAGEVVKRYNEPLDLCVTCLERFGEFMRDGRESVQDDVRATNERQMVESVQAGE